MGLSVRKPATTNRTHRHCVGMPRPGVPLAASVCTGLCPGAAVQGNWVQHPEWRHPRPCLVAEFIQLLSSESNEVATREGRSIIHPDHVLRALAGLGFGSFVGEVQAAWDTFKEETKSKGARGGARSVQA